MNIQNKIIQFCIAGIFVLFITPNSWAQAAEAQKPVFLIKPQGTLPTTVFLGQSVQARYTVTNNMSYVLQANFVNYAHNATPTSAVQNTSASSNPATCSASFTLGPGQSCTLVLDINNTAIGGPQICNGLNEPTRCSNPDPIDQLNVTATAVPVQYVYIGFSDRVATCQIGSTGGVIQETCHLQTNGPLFVYDVILNNNSTMAYIVPIAFFSTSPYTCAVINHDFASCHVSPFSPPVSSVLSGLRFNPQNTLLYITDAGVLKNQIFICPVNLDGTITSCATDNGGGDIFSQPKGRVVFNSAGNKIYVANYSSSFISICDVSSINGSLSNCVNQSDVFINQPLSLDTNLAGTILYVANQDNTVAICPINPNASFGPCTSNSGGGTFHFNTVVQTSTNFFTKNINPFAYFPSTLAELSVCTSNNTTGDLTNCFADPSYSLPKFSVWIANFAE